MRAVRARWKLDYFTSSRFQYSQVVLHADQVESWGLGPGACLAGW